MAIVKLFAVTVIVACIVFTNGQYHDGHFAPLSDVTHYNHYHPFSHSFHSHYHPFSRVHSYSHIHPFSHVSSYNHRALYDLYSHIAPYVNIGHYSDITPITDTDIPPHHIHHHHHAVWGGNPLMTVLSHASHPSVHHSAVHEDHTVNEHNEDTYSSLVRHKTVTNLSSGEKKILETIFPYIKKTLHLINQFPVEDNLPIGGNTPETIWPKAQQIPGRNIFHSLLYNENRTA